MTANIDIIVKETKDAVVIPWDSFFEDEKGNTFVLVPQENFQQKKVAIKTGILDGDNIEVTQGLSKGNFILVKKDSYNISLSKEETKGFLSMGPQKRKTNKDILNKNKVAKK